MKRTFAIILFLSLATAPCAAQWQRLDAGGYWFGNAYAFGVHDGALFFSAQTSVNTKLKDGIWKRQDTASEWVETDAGIDFTQGGPTSFASAGTNLFTGLGNGPSYRSTDGGFHWNSTGVASPVCANGTYVLAYGGTGIYRSGDSGTTWQGVVNDVGVKSFGIDGTCILASTGKDIYRSIDNGTNWSNPISIPSSLALSAFSVIDTQMFAGGAGVFRSVDSSQNWSLVGLGSRTVYALASYKNYLFAGMDTCVLMSSDRGVTWKDVSIGLDKSNPRNVKLMAAVDTFFYTYVLSGIDVAIEEPYGYLARRSLPEMIDATSEVVQDVPTFDSVEIYPNPSTGTFMVSSSGPIVSLQVTKIMGTNILSLSPSNDALSTLDLSREPDGTYFVQVQTQKGSILQKNSEGMI